MPTRKTIPAGKTPLQINLLNETLERLKVLSNRFKRTKTAEIEYLIEKAFEEFLETRITYTHIPSPSSSPLTSPSPSPTFKETRLP